MKKGIYLILITLIGMLFFYLMCCFYNSTFNIVKMDVTSKGVAIASFVMYIFIVFRTKFLDDENS